MNHLMIIGNLCNDPVSHATQTGKNVTTFTVAVNRRRTAQAGQDEADYFRINAWGQLGENCARYLTKGRKVAVTGSVSINVYTTKNGETRAQMDVFADNVEFLSPAEKTAETTVKTPQTVEEAPKGGGFVQVDDEELPF